MANLQAYIHYGEGQKYLCHVSGDREPTLQEQIIFALYREKNALEYRKGELSKEATRRGKIIIEAEKIAKRAYIAGLRTENPQVSEHDAGKLFDAIWKPVLQKAHEIE